MRPPTGGLHNELVRPNHDYKNISFIENVITFFFTDLSWLPWFLAFYLHNTQTLTEWRITHLAIHTKLALNSVMQADNRVTTLQTMWNYPTFPRWFTALVRGTRHVKCYSYHARIVLNTCMDANMQFTINSFRQLSLTKFFPRHFPISSEILTFLWQLSNSRHFLVFPTSGHPEINGSSHTDSAKTAIRAIEQMTVVLSWNPVQKVYTGTIKKQTTSTIMQRNLQPHSID